MHEVICVVRQIAMVASFALVGALGTANPDTKQLYQGCLWFRTHYGRDHYKILMRYQFGEWSMPQ